MDFVAFDLETTGTMAGVNQIVEVGAIRYRDYQPEAVYSTLINPKCSIPEAAKAVNGISDDMLTGKPFIEDILKPFSDFCGNLPLVAHNAPFDTQFLKADIVKHERPGPRGLVFDTLPMARKIFPGLVNYKLGTLVQHLKISSNKFHRAEEDASYCGQIFIEMVKRIFNPGEKVILENLVALTGRAEYRFPIVKRRQKQMEFEL